MSKDGDRELDVCADDLRECARRIFSVILRDNFTEPNLAEVDVVVGALKRRGFSKRVVKDVLVDIEGYRPGVLVGMKENKVVYTFHSGSSYELKSVGYSNRDSVVKIISEHVDKAYQ